MMAKFEIERRIGKSRECASDAKYNESTQRGSSRSSDEAIKHLRERGDGMRTGRTKGKVTGGKGTGETPEDSTPLEQVGPV